MRNLIVVVVLALAGAILWLARDGEREPRPATPTAADALSAAPRDVVDVDSAAIPIDARDANPARTEIAPPPNPPPEPPPPDAMVTIAGIVVDDTGAPVQRAQVNVVESLGRRIGLSTWTGPDGRFSIRHRANDVGPDPFELHVHSDDHEPLMTKAVHAFGEHEVRLVMTSGLPLEVVVRRDADDAPVEQFTVRMLPKPGSRTRWSSSDRRVRGGGHHANGVARVTGIPRGPYELVVEPATSTGLFGAYFIDVNVADGAPLRFDVRLGAAITQRVVVVLGDGSRVVGSKVELLLARPGSRVTAESPAQSFDSSVSDSRLDVRVDTATTAADGACELRGGAIPAFAIRVSSTDHVTTVVTDVRFGVVNPLQIVVRSGATIVGRVTPVEALADLREMAGVPRTGPLDERQARRAPSVRVQRSASHRSRLSPNDRERSSAITEDGTFAIHGIEAGTWELQVTTARDLGGASLPMRPIARTEVTLAADETKDVVLDISDQRFGRLRATVLLDDAPHHGNVQMLHVDGSVSFPVTTDAAGRFESLFAPGLWSAAPSRALASGRFTEFTAPEIATVAPGEVAQVTFRARSAHAKVRVLRADGAPAFGVRMSALAIGSRKSGRIGTTLADGTLEIGLAPGTYQLIAEMPSLDAHRLGEITLPATAEVVLRLPE